MLWLISLLLLTVMASMVRVVLGPTRSDRLLSVQLFGTSGTAVLLMMAYLWDQPALIDAALIIALLAAVITAALVQFLRRGNHD